MDRGGLGDIEREIDAQGIAGVSRIKRSHGVNIMRSLTEPSRGR
jgi:hypothetical protein